MLIGALRTVFVLLFLLVTYLTVAPNPPGPASGTALTRFLASLILGSGQHADKVGHFLAYAALSGTFVLSRFVTPRRAILGVAGLAIYGGFLELVQGMGMSRHMELADAFANAGGALAAYPIAWGVLEVASKARNSRAA